MFLIVINQKASESEENHHAQDLVIEHTSIVEQIIQNNEKFEAISKHKMKFVEVMDELVKSIKATICNDFDSRFKEQESLLQVHPLYFSVQEQVDFFKLVKRQMQNDELKQQNVKMMNYL